MKKDSGLLSVVLITLIAGLVIGTFILGPIFWGPKIQKAERDLCEKEMRVALKMKVRQIGDLTRGFYVDPSVSPEIREAMERYAEQDDCEAGKALSYAQAYGNRTYIDLLTEKIKGNKEEAARLTWAIKEGQRVKKPSTQD